MIRSPRSSRSRMYWPTSPASATSSSILRTRVGAPPCNGPERAPTAADMAEPQSAPVDATMRPVKVEALAPCSAAETSRSPPRARGAGRPRRASEAESVQRRCRQRRPRRREPGLRRAPTGRRGRSCRRKGGRDLEVRHGAAGARRKLDVLGSGHARLEGIVDEETPDLLVGHLPHELLDVDPAIAEGAAFPVRLGDLRLEGDDPLEPWLEVVHAANLPGTLGTKPR